MANICGKPSDGGQTAAASLARPQERKRSSERKGSGCLPFSVVILTKDEAENLPKCLDSLAGVSDDIHIVDSGSHDATCEIARRRGVHVHYHPFSGFGMQRNWAIDHVDHVYDWVLHLDADERWTPELTAEVSKRLADQKSPIVGYYLANRLILGEKWLRYSGQYPTYQLRLFRLGRVRFVNFGHGQREQADGPLAKLDSPYIHDAFAKGIEEWFQKHARYARCEALEAYASQDLFWQEVSGLISRSSVKRRRALKRLSYALPCRGSLRMVYSLILQRGILDGRAGWNFAKMLSIYESMIAVELQMLKSGSQS